MDPATTGRFEAAVAFARDIHAGQTRKGGTTPYLDHVLVVAGHVERHAGTEDERVAAVLHDTVEDGGGLPVLDRIRERFGVRVAGLVDEMSDSVVDTTAGETKAPWRARKEAYIARLGHKSESAALIKAADQLSNLGDCLEDYRKVGDKVWLRFNTGPDDNASKRRELTLWYHRAVLAGLRAHGFARTPAILDEVAEVLDRLERESAS
ncbi:MAG TPA: HD domain-containing protein [Thermoanaerobaculia bacterium]|nr:HD domain-containing protein [Thermoanaerobaculia bacterium]